MIGQRPAPRCNVVMLGTEREENLIYILRVVVVLSWRAA